MTDTPDSEFNVSVNLNPNQEHSMGLKTVHTWSVQVIPGYVQRPSYEEAVGATIGNLRSYADFLESNFLKGIQ